VIVSNVVLVFISLGWGVSGMVAWLFPEWLLKFLGDSLENPWRRFWVGQTWLVSGLILIIGTPILKWFWLWVGCGLIMVIKAGLSLASSDMGRRRLLEYVSARPQWVIRAGGMLNLGLAVGLATDVILHG